MPTVPSQPITFVANRDDGRRFGLCRRPPDAKQSRHRCVAFIEPGTILPRAGDAVQKDAGMDQPPLLGAELFSVEAVALEVASTLAVAAAMWISAPSP